MGILKYVLYLASLRVDFFKMQFCFLLFFFLNPVQFSYFFFYLELLKFNFNLCLLFFFVFLSLGLLNGIILPFVYMLFPSLDHRLFEGGKSIPFILEFSMVSKGLGTRLKFSRGGVNAWMNKQGNLTDLGNLVSKKINNNKNEHWKLEEKMDGYGEKVA